MGQPSLLLVEDDEVDVMAVRRALARHGGDLALTRARNGVEALEVLRRTGPGTVRPCLVLLDLHMPQMGGLEFLDALRGDPELRRTPVFMLTSSDEVDDRRAAYDRGVAGYIVKDRAGPGYRDLMQLIQAYGVVCRPSG